MKFYQEWQDNFLTDSHKNEKAAEKAAFKLGLSFM
ncbi:hypothetical protein A6E11_03700 [Aliivibrio fischeri]|nr:hypothetical protein [Aliivibrio fischeri]OEE27032.1 hypothetical protein A1Q3_13910 [Aliivibrio fischeri ZF-211]MUI63078.1 hypothetical protein [Aliivibrio fischeri]OCH02933.1 hypothetical protein A6E11_03700 [Aliivibrio fischeri]OCH09638.1 hypothetical protein A6E09_12295 [Aliivibrio fischeri]